MKRIVVLLSAILLIFAVACSGDTPVPGDGNGSGSASEIPGAPAVNTGSSLSADEYFRYAEIGFGIDPLSDIEVAAYMQQAQEDGLLSIDFTNTAKTLSANASSQSSPLKFSMNGYETFSVIYQGEGDVTGTKIACTVWGTLEIGSVYTYDMIIKLYDTEGSVFSFYSSGDDLKVNDKAPYQYMNI